MELKHYFLGSCMGILIFILTFTFWYIGTFTLLKVLIALSVLTIMYFVIKGLSDASSFHFEEIRKIVSWSVLLGILFFVSYLLLREFLVNLRIFFHEIAHLIVALSFNLQISEVSIEVTYGHVDYIGDPSLGQRNLLLVSGTLWLVLVGGIFLIMLYRNKKLPLTLNVSLSIILWVELYEDLHYWFMGSIHGYGDPSKLINYNPGLNPITVTYSSFIVLILLCFLAFFSLGYKMYSQFKLINS